MPGEGIGPEMMGHLKQVYKEAAVPVDFEMIELDPSTDNYDDLYNVSSQECQRYKTDSFMNEKKQRCQFNDMGAKVIAYSYNSHL